MATLKFSANLSNSAGTGLNTIFLCYGLRPKMFLYSDGIIGASLDPEKERVS